MLILALMVVIFVKLATGDAPRGLGYTSDFLHLPSGVGALDAGLRRECRLPLVRRVRGGGLVRRGVARPEAHDSALDRSCAIAFGSVFYVICMVAQTLGFGTDAAGVDAFSHSGAPLGDLGKSYVGSAMADVLDVGRDAERRRRRSRLRLGRRAHAVRARPRRAPAPRARRTSPPTTGVPIVALAARAGHLARPDRRLRDRGHRGDHDVLLPRHDGHPQPARDVHRHERRRAPLPLPRRACDARRAGRSSSRSAASAFAIYTLYKNVWPVPDYPFNLFPYIVAAWLLSGSASRRSSRASRRACARSWGRARTSAEEEPAALRPALPSL